MTVALHYSSIKPPAAPGAVLGLQVAIADWLRAWFRHGRAEKFHFLIGDKTEWEEVRALARKAGLDETRLVALDRRFKGGIPDFIGTVARLEPDTRDLLWRRQADGHSFAFCGLAHAISGTEAGAVLQEYCLGPSLAGDAIICPSSAVRSAISAFWNRYADYLKQRFNADYRCPVQLPVIPLGIDTGKFAAKTTPEKRAKARAALGIGESDIVLLWVGRLSAAIKAHPLAMFRAAEQAAAMTGARLHLVMAGYFVPDAARAQFEKLAAEFCRNARVHFVAADDARFPEGAWALGDIFLSLIDNMQESFGLTPLEAAACGLPRVVSDWDGYRDGVTDGEDGFLVRTLMPPPGNGFEFTAQVARGQEVYGGFLAKAALTAAVDAAQAAQYIARLANDADLRRAMGEKARARAERVYDWKHIIPAYENLWDELAARRAAPGAPLASALPTLPDPYGMYESFPTRALAESDILRLAAPVDEIAALWRHEINIYANDAMIAPAELPQLVAFIGDSGGIAIKGIFERFPALERARLWRTLGWLLKLGIFAI